MKLTSYTRVSLLAVSTLAAIWASGCSDDDPDSTAAGGTASDVGGNTGTGGKTSTGTGGKTTTGTGGATATNGGTTGVGGATPTSGGTTAAGGTTTAGGTTSTAGKTSTAGTAGAGATCGTTPSTITTQTTSFATDLGGFTINAASSPNPGKALTQLTDATIGGGMCGSGCAVITGTFAAADPTWGNGVIVQKAFSASTNLVGAKIVAQVAIDNPNNTPIQFKIFAQTGNPDWVWAEKGTIDTASLSLATGVHTFEYPIVDVPGTGTTKTFCAASVFQYGIQIQTNSTAVTATTAGTVKVYLQSISVVPPGGVIVGTGGAAGAPNTGTAGSTNVGTAGGGGTAGTTSVSTAGSTSTSTAGSTSTAVAGNTSTAGNTSMAGDTSTAGNAGTAGAAGSN